MKRSRACEDLVALESKWSYETRQSPMKRTKTQEHDCGASINNGGASDSDDEVDSTTVSRSRLALTSDSWRGKYLCSDKDRRTLVEHGTFLHSKSALADPADAPEDSNSTILIYT